MNIYLSPSLLEFKQTIYVILFFIFFSFIVSYSFFYLQENLWSVRTENLLSQLSLPFLVLCALNWVTRNFAVIQLSFLVRAIPPQLASSASSVWTMKRCTKSKAGFLYVARISGWNIHSTFPEICKTIASGSLVLKNLSRNSVFKPQIWLSHCVIVFCGSRETDVKQCSTLVTGQILLLTEETNFSCSS